jgi:vacuolar-type H+-ATPase subunit C/Vma6
MMTGCGGRAYAFAKACGIVGKSYVGRRVSALSGISRLNELDRLIFPDGGRELPERELLADLEDRIIKRTVSQILAIVCSYNKPPALLVRLVRSYEYSDLKSCVNLIAAGEKKAPVFTDIGPFKTVKFEAFPDLKAMLTGTEFVFLLDKKYSAALRENQEEGGVKIQTELDKFYYTRLRDDLYALSLPDRACAENILAAEITLRNIVWAFRLRTYYKLEGESVKERLMNITMKGRKKSAGLAEDAVASLELSLDTRSAWEGWKWEKFLNPAPDSDLWAVDPRYFQNAASSYLYGLAMRNFRRRPFSIGTAFCFIKLKQFEEDLLTSVSEGLGLGMSSAEVFSLLELRP